MAKQSRESILCGILRSYLTGKDHISRKIQESRKGLVALETMASCNMKQCILMTLFNTWIDIELSQNNFNKARQRVPGKGPRCGQRWPRWSVMLMMQWISNGCSVKREVMSVMAYWVKVGRCTVAEHSGAVEITASRRIMDIKAVKEAERNSQYRKAVIVLENEHAPEREK